MARRAVATVGDPALPGLRHLLDQEKDARGQALAARTVADIASARALQLLRAMVRTGTSAGEGSCGQTRESGDGRTKTSALNGPDARL